MILGSGGRTIRILGVVVTQFVLDIGVHNEGRNYSGPEENGRMASM